MCGCVFTNWSRPIEGRDFDRLERSVASEARTSDLVRALRQAFPDSGMRPTVFIIAMIIESFRSVGRTFVDGIVPNMVRFPFGAYVYNECGEVTERYQTEFQAAVHDQMPEFLMSAQTVHRLNLVLERFGFVMTTDGCCGEIFLPREELNVFLESAYIAQREAARQEATKQGMRFKRVRNTGSIPFEGSDLGPAERDLHDRLARQMVRLCGPLTKAHEPLRKPVSIASTVRRLAAA